MKQLKMYSNSQKKEGIMSISSFSSPFIVTTPHSSTPHFQMALHNLQGLGRTNTLHHLLSPSSDSLEGSLQHFWKAFSEKHFNLPAEAESFITLELENIHPIVVQFFLNDYTTKERAKGEDYKFSLVEIQEFARKFFAKIPSIAKRLSHEFSPRVCVLTHKAIPNEGFRHKSILELPNFESIAREQLLPFWTEINLKSYNTKDEALSNIKLLLESSEIPLSISTIYLENLKSAQNLTDLTSHIKSYIIDLTRHIPLAQLSATWDDILIEDYQTPETALEDIKNRLARINLPGIRKLYLDDISIIINNKAQGLNWLFAIQKRVASYKTDIISVQSFESAGLIPTKSGVVGYPKIIDWQRSSRILGFMKYLNNATDMDLHLLYSSFFNTLSHSSESSSSSSSSSSSAAAAAAAEVQFLLKVPSGEMFDPSTLTYVDSSGERTELSEKYRTNELAQILQFTNFIASANTRRSAIENENKFQEFIHTHPLGFFEKVEGSDLIGFLLGDYQNLDLRSKTLLFISLGKLAFFDLILGNQDRLIRFEDLNNPTLEPEYGIIDCNLENIMVSKDLSALYLIDNAIGDGKEAPSSEENTAHLNFLESMLRQPNHEELIAKYLMNALNTAIDNLKENIGGTKTEQETQVAVLTTLQKDIKTLQEAFHQAFIEGIQQMKRELLERIVPAWKSNIDLQAKINPELKDTIDARLAFFSVEGQEKLKALP